MTEDYVYCPRCGAPLSEKVAFGRVRRCCRYCGFIHFRDPKVAVAGLIFHTGRVLLVRRIFPPRPGLWALPAGFMDHDELPEETLHREIAEETGLSVRLLGLHAIVPLGGWEERRGILLVYRAEVVSGEAVAADDASEVGWFGPADVPWSELAFETTTEFLHDWVASLADVDAGSSRRDFTVD